MYLQMERSFSHEFKMDIEPTGIELKVCKDMAIRQAHGINKYGKTVADNPLSLREWLQHAYEECLDQAVYLRRAMEEIDKKPTRNPNVVRHYFRGEGNQCKDCGHFREHDIHA